jgi:hypothetical protein
MMNFFDQTNETTGEVTICLDPTTTSPSCSSDPSDNVASGSHAKPLLIQGALAAAQYTNDFSQFRPYNSKMSALLSYWSRERKHEPTGLYTWHDQMESGADNLVLSPCPSPRSACWVEEGEEASKDQTRRQRHKHLTENAQQAVATASPPPT